MSLFSKRFHNFCSGGVSCSKFRFCLPKSLFAICINGSCSVSLIKKIVSASELALFFDFNNNSKFGGVSASELTLFFVFNNNSSFIDSVALIELYFARKAF